MPYCVNCGVELKADAKRCPLCHVEVILPDHLREDDKNLSLPQQRHIVEKPFDKNLWIQVISVLVAIPALISLVVNAVLNEALTWSRFVVASLATAWVWCISPFLWRRNIVPLWVTMDAAALLGLLYAIDALTPTSAWFLPLALPITLSLELLFLLVITLARRYLHSKLRIGAAALMAVGIFCLLVEGTVDLYLTGAIMLQWSLIVLVSCTSLALIAVMLYRRRNIVEGMKAWFRV
jgi:hypothetical protein